MSLTALTEEQREIQMLARAFAADEIAPHAARWDREACFPVAVAHRMGELGFLGMLLPEQYDGLALDTTSYLIALEEIAAADASAAVLMSVHNSLPTQMLLNFGSDEQRERFLRPMARGEIIGAFALSEPDAGSDASALRCQAVRSEDGASWILNGTKSWVSSGTFAGAIVVMARTDTPDRRAGSKGISAFIVTPGLPGFHVGKKEDKMGLRASPTVQLNFDGLRVPAANLLGEVDHGWPITQGSLAHERAMLWIDYAYNVERSLRGLVALGAEPGAGGGRIGDDAVYRDEVASVAIDAQALLCMGYRGFSKFMAGKSAPEHSLLKLFGSESVQRSLGIGTTAIGAAGLDRNRLGPRLWRDGAWLTQWMRSFGGTIPGGTSEIQRNIIAERVLGLPRA